jgi:hypothetical protein
VRRGTMTFHEAHDVRVDGSNPLVEYLLIS